MDVMRIKLAAVWVSLMLTYLLGDVLRVYAGDVVPGQIQGSPMSQGMLAGIAGLMFIPILMILLTLTVKYPAIRWINFGVAIFFFLFNAVGLPGYSGWYDRLLIIAGLGLNVLTVIWSVRWVPAVV